MFQQQRFPLKGIFYMLMLSNTSRILATVQSSHLNLTSLLVLFFIFSFSLLFGVGVLVWVFSFNLPRDQRHSLQLER